MFTPHISVTSPVDKKAAILKNFQELKDMDVLVGIPQEKSSRPKDGELITNAELLFIHTNGSPLRHIPKRPVIEPAIEHDKEIPKIMGEAAKAALAGDAEKAMQELDKAGLEGQAAAQDWFLDPRNGWPENSERVKLAKIKKGSTEPIPLIDTGEMRKAITYVVRKKKR